VPAGAARAAAGGVRARAGHAHAGRPQGVIRVGARDAGRSWAWWSGSRCRWKPGRGWVRRTSRE
jgi:hypothetical protein